MKTRSQTPELIDLGPSYYTEKEYHDCLFQLSRIGKYLGGNRATLQKFRSLSPSPTSILDVGCGGGFFTLMLAKAYPHAHVVGIDISQAAVDYAKEMLAKDAPPVTNLTFSVPPTPELTEPPKSYDVVTATLVCHHLTDVQIVQFLRSALSTAKRAVIINDLHRHPIAYGTFSIIAPLFFPNRLICHDGLLSIRRSFTRKDWIALLEQAKIPTSSYTLTRHFPYRWVLVIFPEKDTL